MLTFEDKFKRIFQNTSSDVAQSLLNKLQKAGIKSPVVNNVISQISNVYKTPQGFGRYTPAQPQEPSLMQRVGEYTSPQPKVRPIDIVRELPKAGWQTFSYPVKKLFNLLGKSSAHTLNIVASPIETIAAKIGKDPNLVTTKDMLNDASEKWQSRATRIGNVFTDTGIGLGVYDEDAWNKLAQPLVKNVMDKNKNLFERTTNFASLIDVSVMRLFADPLWFIIGKGFKTGKDIILGENMIQEQNAFRILNLKQGATVDEINTAFRNSVKNVHPDTLFSRLGRNPTENEILNSQKAFSDIVSARNTLIFKFKKPITPIIAKEEAVKPITRKPVTAPEQIIRGQQVPQLIEGGLKTPVIPGAKAGFQMLIDSNPQAAQSLLKKLQNNLKVKQELLKAGKVKPAQLSLVDNAIKSLQTSLKKVEQDKKVILGPERTTPEISKQVSATMKQAVSKPSIIEQRAIALKERRIGNISKQTQKFLGSSIYKSSDLTEQIMKELSPYKPSKPVILYRAVRRLPNQKKINYTEDITFWMPSKEYVAKYLRLSNESNKIPEILEAKFNPEDIIVNLSQVGQTFEVPHEMLIRPGKYDIKVLKFEGNIKILKWLQSMNDELPKFPSKDIIEFFNNKKYKSEKSFEVWATRQTLSGDLPMYSKSKSELQSSRLPLIHEIISPNKILFEFDKLPYQYKDYLFNEDSSNFTMNNWVIGNNKKEISKEQQFQKTLEELQKERVTKVKAKPIEPTPWVKRQISKEEYKALEARKKIHAEERKVKTYAERVKERAIELKKIDKQKVAAAKLRIAEAKKQREIEGVSSAQLLREEKLLKGLQQFEDQTGRIVNNQKAERLSKIEIEIQDLNKQLIDAKKAGKDEGYFRDLDVKLFNEFLEGKSKIDKSAIVSQFIDDNFGVGKAEKYPKELMLQSRIFFLPSEIANGIDSTWQKIIGDKAYAGFKWFMNKLSEIKVTTPSAKAPGISVHYPFEYLFGTKLENLRPYDRQLQKGIALAKSEVLDMAKDLSKLTPDEQSIVLKKIESMDYSNDKLGIIAKELESKFVGVGYDLVKRGLMKEETFKEYLGKYFPRIYEAFEESNKIAYDILKKRLSNQAYMKLRKDAYGVIYRDGRQKIVKKFETRQERDNFVKNELKPKNKKYDTFAPIKQDKIEELKRIEKLPYVVITRLMQEMKDVVIWDYLDALSKDKNIVSNIQDIEKGYVNMIPKTPAYGNLGGKYIHEWYYSNVKNLIELPTTVDRSFRLFNGIVKGMKTIVDPAVGFANAVSNLFLADWSGVPIERTDYWVRNLYNSLTNKGAYKILASEGATKQTYAIEEIEKFMRIDEVQEELKTLLYNDSKLSTLDLMSTLYGFVKKGWIKAGDLYSFSEDWAKSVCFDWATNELGMGREEAIQFAQNAIYNYSEVSGALKALRRSFAGAAFPTFAAKVINAGIKAQIRKPFTIAKWHFIFGSIAAASLAYYGITKDDIKRLKPESVGSWFIVTDVTKDTRGNITDIQLLDFSRYLPWGQMTSMPLGIDSASDLIFHPELLTTTQRGKNAVFQGQNILSAFMPGQLIIKPTFESIYNYSTFTKKEIYPSDATPLEKMFATEDYLAMSWLPSWTPSVVPEGKGGYMYQKLYSAFLQIPDFQGRVTAISEALLRIIGTKISHIRPEDEFSFLLSEVKNNINTYKSKLRAENSRYDAAIQNREATSSSKNQAKIRYDEKTKLYEQKLETLINEYDVIIDAQIQFEKNTKK